MDDPDAGPSSEPVGDGGQASHGIVSYLTSLRGIVSTVAALVIAIGGLITALNQAGLIGGDDDNGQTTTIDDERLFAPVTRPNGRVYYDGDVLYVRASTPSRPLLHLAESDEAFGDISFGGLLEWVSGAKDYAFGFVCRYRNAANYYLLSVLSGGRYNIVRYRDGKPFSLTGGFEEDEPLEDESNRVYAKCVGHEPTTLSIDVNGRTVASAEDAEGIDTGIFGLRVGSGESFVVLKLEALELRHL
jgi:hypothetical protein